MQQSKYRAALMMLRAVRTCQIRAHLAAPTRGMAATPLLCVWRDRLPLQHVLTPSYKWAMISATFTDAAMMCK